MGEQEHTKQPVQEERPLDLEGVPDEEDVSTADSADRVDAEPDEQLNRPDQPDFDESERRQYEDPPLTDPPTAENHPGG
ncbi:hypothetical protein ACFP8W_08835 [Nocardioides hankookensis]|uniref:Uncharacterized protein n=1 Tax=Nocardioides hankookensis TaxID=443157 RepID=A0ABW1LNY2_9ACTN